MDDSDLFSKDCFKDVKHLEQCLAHREHWMSVIFITSAIVGGFMHFRLFLGKAGLL